MHGFVFPAVAEIALIIVETNHHAVEKQSESLRGQFVVLVDFRQAIRKIILRVIDGMREWQLDELRVGQNFFHFAAEARVHAIVVVGEQESAGRKVRAQVLGVVLAERDVAVAVEENNRLREKLERRRFDGSRFNGEAHVRVLAGEHHEVPERPRRAVPVAAALVFEEADFGRAQWCGGLRPRRTIYKDRGGEQQKLQVL